MNDFTINININAPELADAIQAFVKAITCHTEDPYINTAPELELKKEAPKETKAAPKPEPSKKAKKEEPKKEKKTEPAPAYTLETVRTKLAALAQAGKQEQVKDLITSFGVKKLTDIPENKYPEVMKKAEEIS